MTQPTPYTRQFDFESFQSAQPTTPLPGVSADAEWDALKVTLDETLANLAILQRDDTALANAVVHANAFNSAALALIASTWTPRGDWATATAYAIGDVVEEASVSYVCAVAHTSGVFATDNTAGNWTVITGAAGPSGAQGVPGLTYEGTWATSTAYDIGDVVKESGVVYHCLVAHTSGTFATDLAAAKWEELLPVPGAAYDDVQYTADGVATTKVLASAPIDVNTTVVYFDGVRQYPTVDYTLSSNTVTWVAGAPSSGVEIYISWFALAVFGLADGDVTNAKLADMTSQTLKGRKTASTGDPEDFTIGGLTEETAPAAADMLLGEEAGGNLLRRFAVSSLRQLPTGHISGLLPSVGTDTAHDLDFTAGKVRNDADDADLAVAALTKKFDAAFAAGDNQGCLGDTVVLPTSGTMHVFVVSKDADGTVDILGDTSFTGANVPAGWTVERRVFSFRTDGSDNIIAFSARRLAGGALEVLLDDPLLDVDDATPGTAAVTRTLTVPAGFQMQVMVNAYYEGSTTAGGLYLSALDANDEAPSFAAGPLASVGVNTGAGNNHVGQVRVRTNTSSQIRSRSTSNLQTSIATLGWVDERL